MVKGITRQVIVVHSPEPKLFDQAIFILSDKAVEKGVTEESLLKEAKLLMALPPKTKNLLSKTLWTAAGALLTGAAWLLTVLF